MFEAQHLTRQLDILPTECLDKSITVIGAGAIGSFAVLSLAKMGFEDITVYDFDTIEIENMSCQFYRFGDIGKPKVEALRDLVEDFTKVKINAINGTYEGAPLGGIVISAVDSMEVRKLIWEGAKKSPSVSHVIDPRMGAEVALLYTAIPHDEGDVTFYEKTLYSDDDSVHERCTAKATMYTVNMLSGLVAKTVKDLATKAENYPRSVTWMIKDNFFQCFSHPDYEKKKREGTLETEGSDDGAA